MDDRALYLKLFEIRLGHIVPASGFLSRYCITVQKAT